ncbi:MAG: pyridoxamine 5'-phosphate oxidase [Flavobacteriales bacterium]|nr:pyridoxamine 5'-phosphate oxidase [Flavobacteriales bacterium]
MDKKQNEQAVGEDLSMERRSYEKYHLDEASVTDNPMDLFQGWYNIAHSSADIEEANAMTLCTISPEGTPRGRVVLLKRFTWEGFYFYTNYNSTKGKSIEAHHDVCLSFFWDALERQVIIEGVAEKTTPEASDGYFATRPRGSRLGAWASAQSSVVPSRDFLDAQLDSYEKKFEGKDVTRPPHCGMYLVRPRVIEFWQGRPNRMHDRLRFTLNKETFEWKLERLAP